tara:strand:+ start:195 stop:653 length:459 start_codon:yes stop_codon:yes gene_type:complete
VPRFSERGSGENKTPARVDAFVFARRQRREKVNTKFEENEIALADALVRALGTFDAKSEHGDVQEIEPSVDVDRSWETRGRDTTYFRTFFIFWSFVETAGDFGRVRESRRGAKVGGACDGGDGEEVVRTEEIVRFRVYFGRRRRRLRESKEE